MTPSTDDRARNETIQCEVQASAIHILALSTVSRDTTTQAYRVQPMFPCLFVEVWSEPTCRMRGGTICLALMSGHIATIGHDLNYLFETYTYVVLAGMPITLEWDEYSDMTKALSTRPPMCSWSDLSYNAMQSAISCEYPVQNQIVDFVINCVLPGKNSTLRACGWLTLARAPVDKRNRSPPILNFLCVPQ